LNIDKAVVFSIAVLEAHKLQRAKGIQKFQSIATTRCVDFNSLSYVCARELNESKELSGQLITIRRNADLATFLESLLNHIAATGIIVG
jgi:hypothetical protein